MFFEFGLEQYVEVQRCLDSLEHLSDVRRLLAQYVHGPWENTVDSKCEQWIRWVINLAPLLQEWLDEATDQKRLSNVIS